METPPLLRRKLVLSDVRSRLLGHLLLSIPGHNGNSAKLAIIYIKVTESSVLEGWPSGLRRNVKAVVLIGVGSNPIPFTFLQYFVVHDVIIDSML